MSSIRLQTPVAFIVFNRPDTTARVFERIAAARPPKLLVIADGPRADRPGEAALCAAARAVVETVDWECEVLRNYSEFNLGCKQRVSGGIDWVFAQVPEAIILEDDCLPDPSFFPYCEALLQRYRDDERVAQIAGANFQFGRRRGAASYYFSRYQHIWGWASWARAWRHYDRDLSAWPQIRDAGLLASWFSDRDERRFWLRTLARVHAGDIDTWDYQWAFAALQRGMVSVVPEVNLISNIGFGAGATHTRGASIHAAMATEAMGFPLQHPERVEADREADAATARDMFSASLLRRALRRIKALL